MKTVQLRKHTNSVPAVGISSVRYWCTKYGMNRVHETGASESTLTYLALGKLRQMILSGELPGGTVVPERRVAERLGQSRTSVRAAMGVLEGEGYLHRDGRITIVTTIRVEEIIEIMMVRRVLEVEAARLAAGHLSGSQIQEIRSAILSMRDRKSTKPEHHWQVDDLVHLSIAEATGNHLLLQLIAELREKTRMFGLARIPARFELGKSEHLDPIAAIEAGNAKAATDAMARHLDNARSEIIRTISEGRRR
jgi:DNA-binding GntR family transcriptional regulator